MGHHCKYPSDWKIPQRLYKYSKFNLNSFDSVFNNSLYFADPASFDDPYEPILLSDFEPEFKLACETDLRNSGITCLSTSMESLYLWSFYTSGLKGFCIEFDKEILLKSIEETIKSEIDHNPWLYLFKVDYVKKGMPIPVINQDDILNNKQEANIEYFATKPDLFESEKEVRFVIRPKSGHSSKMMSMKKSISYSQDAVKGIIFGENANKGYIQALKCYYGKNVDFKVAKLSHKQHRIKVCPLDPNF